MRIPRSPLATTSLCLSLMLTAAFALPAWSKDVDEHQERHNHAIERARSMVAAQPTPSPSSLVGLGDALLRGGRCAEATENFERAIKRDPASEPYLWQYGIALFFVGRFDDARSLFEKHRLVNPNDVENAAWHFLCVAKADDIVKARTILLPAPGDSRVPMEEVLQRLQGGSFDGILAAVEQTRGTSSHASAEFYGNLYIGMIADAEGDSDAARAHLQKASNAGFTHYMADVARVYANELK